ncbi:hypothetical protein Pan153_31880 [Gimesia panareensis]|uniref:Uncharacterized protein n=1 Tax=Gimesia panareensis TaxID=2527978 RepID=A0A518FQH5_9PLAN|nr:hypothetical protein Pan153_31880 [Gimesia panareensis]
MKAVTWRAKKSPFSKLPEIENGENAFDSREESGIRAKKAFHGYRLYGLPDVMGVLNESHPSPVVKDAEGQVIS